MVMEGKQQVFLAGLFLNLAALILLLVSFVTPFWVQSWPRVHSPFKRIGMWEACFAGLILERDPAQKAYHGCWWILAPEYWKIREWLMPPWFVLVQIITTVCVVLGLINIVLLLNIVMDDNRRRQTGSKRRVKLCPILTSTIFTVISGVAMPFAVVLFGICTYTDRMWMPRPDLNYLSWSFGLAVLSAFFSLFASIPMVKYNKIIRQEYRDPPSLQAVAMLQVKDSSI